MRIVILTVGTLGDVQPLVALGLGLQQAGHHVRLATHTNFQAFVTGAGLEFFSIEGDSQEQMQQEEGQAMLESGNSSIRYLLNGIRLFRSYFKRLLVTCWEACQGADIVISSLNSIAGPHIAEALRLPCYMVWFYPAYRTRAFPLPLGAGGVRLGGFFNQTTYVTAEQLGWQFLRRTINRWRNEMLGLKSLSFVGPALTPFSTPYGKRDPQRPLLLCGYSSSIAPRPADWPSRIHITGYWYLNRDTSWQPPKELSDFLADGPPPVSVGFGSMIDRNPALLTSMTIEALKRTGQRGILLTGWSGLDSATLPGTMLKVDSVPHEWLFPHMAAVVHHGGAGTTAAGLRAGRPTVIIPFAGDQHFWGQRMADLGVGPRPIPHKQLSVDSLADAIYQVTTQASMRARAAVLAQQIQAEDGVGRAIELIQQDMARR